MKFTADQIASILEGEIDGNPNVEVSNLSKIEEGKKGTLSFLSNPKYTPFIYTTNASIVIVNKDGCCAVEARRLCKPCGAGRIGG